MSRQIDAYQFAFLVQSFYIAPAFVGLWHSRTLYLYIVKSAKQRITCLLFLRLIVLTITYENFNKRLAFGVLAKEVLTTNTKTVEAATKSQCLKCLTVDQTEVDAFHKIIDILIDAVLLAFVNDSLRHIVAHTFDGSQSETYLTFLVYTELLVRLVDIRSQRINTHRPTFVHQLSDFCDLVAATAHDGSHKLSGIVGFQISGLESHPRIAGSMRLVEGIRGESFPVTPYLFQYLWIVSVLLSTLNEFGFHGINNVLLLFTHCLTQGITLTTGKVCQQS